MLVHRLWTLIAADSIPTRRITQLWGLKMMLRPTIHKQNPHASISAISALWNKAVKLAGIRRRNPYHTGHEV